VCRKRWREDDHLSLVAGITLRQRQALEEIEVATLASLGRLALPLDAPLDGIGSAALTRVREQARIQLEGREAGGHRYELFTDVPEGYGLGRLPEPSPGDLFFDIESDPYALEEGLEYLFGYCDAQGAFTAEWALTRAEERAMFERFIDRVMARLEIYPDLHIYHFGHYESGALKRLAGRYGAREAELDRLLEGRVLVDLHRVVTQSLRASVESYSIKKLEPLFGFEREVDLRTASSALSHFEAWLALGGGDRAVSDLLNQIEGYNRDDCVSTARLRDWLEGLRDELAQVTGAPVPRPLPPELKGDEGQAERRARMAALTEALIDGVPDDPLERSAREQARWLLAQLLEFHRREKKAFWWQYFEWLGCTEDELLEDRRTLAGLEYERVVDTVMRSEVHRYRFPRQDHGFSVGDAPKDPANEGGVGTVWAIDDVRRTIDLKRRKASEAPHPRALIPHEKFPDQALKESLLRLAESVVEHGIDGARERVAMSLVLAEPPRGRLAQGSAEPGADGELRLPGEDTLDAGRRLALALTESVLPVQGPPGSGKTYTGARVVLDLLRAGKRVGVTAHSHKVISNLLTAICDAADEANEAVAGIQLGKENEGCSDPRIELARGWQQVAEGLTSGEIRLAAGTAWLWARPELAESIDVLVVDEAAQMSLANVLASAPATGSLILLGDPQQLDQPTQGVHPPGVGVSALAHVSGGALTLPGDRGLFLDRTWRLHPSLCAFTSEVFYEGRLEPTERKSLGTQAIVGGGALEGAGLRMIAVDHSGNTSESSEEVAAVRELVRHLLDSGTSWTDADGETRPLTLNDVLIVAPYNAHVGALVDALPVGARVGTVDKFQGQQAPIVVYSMASSAAEDAPRGMEFLYSPNRLNVATSRAQCVAVVVASPSLFTPDCRSVRQMTLGNAFCRLAEMAGRPEVPPPRTQEL
jgi:uncharacterized protein